MSINHHDPVWALKLQYLQANILKHHGRDNAWHIFLSFDAGQQENTKELLQNYALKLTSAARQLADVDLRKIHEHHDGGIVRCMFLSKAGYDTLSLKKDVWAGNTTDNAFINGMRLSKKDLNDPEVDKWETPYQQILHGMILIADDELSVLEKELDDIRANFNNVITIVHVQKGEVLRNPEGIGIEHFGYVDGISQPEFLISAQHHGKVYSDAADENLVLINDPGVTATGTNLDRDCFGSFFVFRKLEQNVKEFKEREDLLGETLYPNPIDKDKREIAGAYVVGRFESSSPVVKHKKEEKIDKESKIDNDFDYSTDISGSKCPFHAHIRAVNPRNEQRLGEQTVPSNPIARRGIPYDEAGRNGNLNWEPEGDVGLLFMAYQKSLEEGFEAMQKEANRKMDGVIGQFDETKSQNWPKDHGNSTPVKFPFASSVKLKGGEYFFAPSLFFLHNLTSL